MIVGSFPLWLQLWLFTTFFPLCCFPPLHTQVSHELSSSSVWPERRVWCRGQSPARERPCCQLPHRAPAGETRQRRDGSQQWVSRDDRDTKLSHKDIMSLHMDATPAFFTQRSQNIRGKGVLAAVSALQDLVYSHCQTLPEYYVCIFTDPGIPEQFLRTKCHTTWPLSHVHYCR